MIDRHLCFDIVDVVGIADFVGYADIDAVAAVDAGNLMSDLVAALAEDDAETDEVEGYVETE